MPLYGYRCPEGHEVTRVRPVSARNEPVVCEEHEVEASRQWDAPGLNLTDGYTRRA